MEFTEFREQLADKFEKAENRMRIKPTSLRIFESITCTWTRRVNKEVRSSWRKRESKDR